jgi:hypothetical protein
MAAKKKGASKPAAAKKCVNPAPLAPPPTPPSKPRPKPPSDPRVANKPEKNNGRRLYHR